MTNSNYTKTELLEELKRYLKRAWKRGCTTVSLEKGEMLALLRLDGLGGEADLPSALDDVAAAANCRHMSSGGHRDQIAFIRARSGTFA